MSSKFKLLKHQSKKSLCFVKKNDLFIKKGLKFTKIKSKIIKIDTNKDYKLLSHQKNEYFLTEANKENLLFVLAIIKKFKLNKQLLNNTIQKFKGLKYRQQIIYKNRNLTIINDSKSTSFSSSVGILKTNPNIYWLLGGIYKKGDKLEIPKKYYHNIKAFVYGKKRNFFNNQLKRKIKVENFKNLKDALKKVLTLVKKQKFVKKTILFSPSAASFDSFSNFEDRGQYFNKLIKKYFNE